MNDLIEAYLYDAKFGLSFAKEQLKKKNYNLAYRGINKALFHLKEIEAMI